MSDEIGMKQQSRTSHFLQQIATLPLSVLRLSRGKRVLIILLSYALGIPGLWFFLPRLHNAASMLLPIICLCWLFRYRGLLISIPSILLALWLIRLYLLPYTFSSAEAFGERAVLGFGIGLLFGLVTCWLRTAVDLVQAARSHALAAEQERLRAEYSQRQATFAYEQQRKINELKDEFLLNVNHELRTPLTLVGGFLELLNEHYEKLDPMERAQMLKEALASQEELLDVANRVLDATMVVSEVPQPNYKVVPVCLLLQEVLAALPQKEAQAYTIRLLVSEQVMVWTDPQLLRQVLHNLLSNIFKYVPMQTEIRIEAVQEGPSSPVCLSVHDAGPGIPADELPLLFEKFVRLKRDLAGRARGTGLGLYICKQLVEAMGGQIWVESSGRMGEGCRFCLILPPSHAIL